ncbi:unnamed protein product [Rotaria sp. Silwood1]|nr:unnamed protein product [Rotaria sp. Silwood1]CAF1398517.1 unnamed protein product [Rotaria sp. Silwood1]CAF1400445.1 unnamed protein product [Rotaria sp. Silwood1]
MSLSKQSIQSYYMEFLCCATCSHDFEYENPLYHPITLPMCGHTMCKYCIIICNETKCPQDQISFEINHTPIDQLPINYPLLMIFYDSSKLPKDKEQRHGQCPSYMKLDIKTKSDFETIEKFLGEISLMFKRIINDRECQLIFSRSTIRKIFNLLNIQFIDCKNLFKILKAINSLAKHICIDFIVHYQDHQQLIQYIQSNIGLRHEQIVESDMIETILKLILLFNENHPMKQNDKFSSTLYIKSEYEKYENLRGVFDSTFIGMIIKTGLIVSSEQWSSLLYGDVKYEVAMEIIIKKFSTSDTFTKSIEKLLQILEQAGVHQNNLSKFETSFKFLPTIYLNINNDNEDNRLSWMKIALVIKTFREGVQCLPYFNQ